MILALLFLLLQAGASSGLEFGALISAVAFLSGTVIAIAKVAWTERLNRLLNAESERDYYRNVAVTNMKEISDSQSTLTTGLSSLTDVVEKAVHQGDMGYARSVQSPQFPPQGSGRQ